MKGSTSLLFANGPYFNLAWFVTLMFSTYQTFMAQRFQNVEPGAALFYAITTSMLSFVVFAAAMHFFPRFKTPATLLLACALLIVSCLGVFYSSSTQNMIGIGAKYGLAHFRKEEVSRNEYALDKNLQQNKELQNLLPAFRQQAVKYAMLQKGEFDQGILTGKGGAGDVERGLARISSIFNGTAELIDVQIADINQQITNAQLILERMRKSSRTDGSHDEIMSEMAKEADEFRLILSGLNSRGSAIAIGLSLEDLSEVINSLSSLSANPRFAAKQREVLAQLHSGLRETEEKLAPHIKELMEARPSEIPVFERVTPREAVYRFWLELLHWWLIATFCDLWVMIILAYGMIHRLSYTRVQRQAEQYGDITLSDWLWYEEIRKAVESRSGLNGMSENIRDIVMGLDDKNESENPKRRNGRKIASALSKPPKASRTPIIKTGDDDHVD